MSLATKALSVRQPWAWAIIHAGKPVENRSAASVRHMNFAGVTSIAIHAARGMTREEYEEAAEFMVSIGVICPPARDLLRGGVIGAVDVLGVVSESESPWFFGPRGIVLANPQPCEFIPARGLLGLFDWRRDDGADPPLSSAKWMLADTSRPPLEPQAPQLEL